MFETITMWFAGLCGGRNKPKPSRAEAAAKIQARLRGMQSRKDLANQHAAATKVQAARRGIMARRDNDHRSRLAKSEAEDHVSDELLAMKHRMKMTAAAMDEQEEKNDRSLMKGMQKNGWDDEAKKLSMKRHKHGSSRRRL